MTIQVVLADDHRVLREALRRVLEADGDLEVLGEARTGREAVEMTAQLRPDLVVMDLSMPELGGIEATREIASRSPRTRVLVLTQHDALGQIREALEAGAAGYVLKTASARELVDAVREVHDGRSYLSPDVTSHLVGALARPEPEPASPLMRLTSREREILRRIAEGLSNKEIAADLGLSVRTVEAHRASVMGKLGVHKVTNLVRLAIREGLIQP